MHRMRCGLVDVPLDLAPVVLIPCPLVLVDLAPLVSGPYAALGLAPVVLGRLLCPECQRHIPSLVLMLMVQLSRRNGTSSAYQMMSKRCSLLSSPSNLWELLVRKRQLGAWSA